MAWECACGIENRESSKSCSGCGWTIERSEEYKKQSSQNQSSISAENFIDPEVEKSGINNTENFHFIIYGMLSTLIVIALVILTLMITRGNETISSGLDKLIGYLFFIFAGFYVASFVFIYRLVGLLNKRGIKTSMIIVILFFVPFGVLFVYTILIRDTKSVGWWPKGGFKTFIGRYK